MGDVATAQCARKDCPNEGMWNPQVMVSPDGVNYAKASFMRLPVCNYHRDLTSVDNLIGEPDASFGREAEETGWDVICILFRELKLKEPKREFTKIEWEEY